MVCASGTIFIINNIYIYIYCIVNEKNVYYIIIIIIIIIIIMFIHTLALLIRAKQATPTGTLLHQFSTTSARRSAVTRRGALHEFSIGSGSTSQYPRVYSKRSVSSSTWHLLPVPAGRCRRRLPTPSIPVDSRLTNFLRLSSIRVDGSLMTSYWRGNGPAVPRMSRTASVDGYTVSAMSQITSDRRREMSLNSISWFIGCRTTVTWRPSSLTSRSRTARQTGSKVSRLHFACLRYD